MSVFARVCVHRPFTQCYFQTTALEHQPFLTATGCGSHDEFMSTPFCPHVHCGKRLLS